jgi:serine/threonine protein phosphatase PrpC
MMSPPTDPSECPPAVKVHVEFGAESRPGPRRSISEDHYLIVRLGRHQETLRTSLPLDKIPKRFDEFAYGMVIADGIGPAGEIASRLALIALEHLAVNSGKWNVRINEPIAGEVMDRAERLFRHVDATLLQAGQHIQVTLEATLTGVYTAGNELFFAHVGHSRAYLFRDGGLLQLTQDHDPPEAAGVTGTSRQKVDIERCGLEDGDAVLLCTRGLTDVVDDGRIASAMRRHRAPDDQCRALADLATESNGDADVTALVAQYQIPG